MSNETETNEANNEATKPAEEWLEPSPVGSEFMRHSAAMEPAARVPVRKAFAIAPGFNVGMLRKMAEAFRPKRIVVIDHGEQGFEVRRLAANDDVSLFYLSLNPAAKIEVEQSDFSDEQKARLKKTIAEFLQMSEEDITKYDAQAVKLRSGLCIGYSFIQRKCAAIAAFRRDAEGSTLALRRAIGELESEGVLHRLPEDEATEMFQTTAAVYRINKNSFFEA
jgi:hypothetical protein